MSFLSQLSWRYATKVFDQNKKVSEENLEKVFDSIKLAPTSFGLQPFHVINVADKSKRVELRAMAWDQSQVTDASHFLVFCARKDIANRIDQYFDLATGGDETAKTAMSGFKNVLIGFNASLAEDQKIPWATRQAYIALGFALAACAELEIDSCPMEGFDSENFKKALALPDYMTPVVCLAIGYRSENDKIRPKVRFDKLDLISSQ